MIGYCCVCAQQLRLSFTQADPCFLMSWTLNQRYWLHLLNDIYRVRPTITAEVNAFRYDTTLVAVGFSCQLLVQFVQNASIPLVQSLEDSESKHTCLPLLTPAESSLCPPLELTGRFTVLMEQLYDFSHVNHTGQNNNVVRFPSVVN